MRRGFGRSHKTYSRIAAPPSTAQQPRSLLTFKLDGGDDIHRGACSLRDDASVTLTTVVDEASGARDEPCIFFSDETIILGLTGHEKRTVQENGQKLKEWGKKIVSHRS